MECLDFIKKNIIIFLRGGGGGGEGGGVGWGGVNHFNPLILYTRELGARVH